MRLPEIARLGVVEPHLPRLVERLEPEVRRPVVQRLADPALHEGVEVVDRCDGARGRGGGSGARAVAVAAFAWPAGFGDDVGRPGGVGVLG